MRKIRFADGMDISFHHAGASGEALTSVEITIPLDGTKYMEGVNIIDCIKERLMPDLNLLALNQEFTANDRDLIRGYLQTGVFHDGTFDFYFTEWNRYDLLIDDASLGVATFTDGAFSPTYT